mgnify:CR=1 FL=1
MKQKYDPQAIQTKWQKKWEADGLYHIREDSPLRKFYVLTMLPYTSGDLHIGHWYAMAPSDARARFLRMKGFNVMFPLCFDVNGTPVEVRVEKKFGINKYSVPRQEYIKMCEEYANSFIDSMTQQFEILGESMDPSIYYQTDAPYYRRITQISFLKMLEKDPSRRYADAASLAKALEQVGNEMKTPAPPPPPPLKTVIHSEPGKATAFQEPGQARGQSVLEDFGAAAPSADEQVQLLYPNGKTKSYPIRAGKVLTAGRDTNNDIVLEDAQASRNHARIEFDGKVFRITDLNSRNGTFLEGAKLLPGIAETWPYEKAVQIGGCHLRLLRGQEKHQTAVIAPDQANAPVGAARKQEAVARAQVDERVDVTLEKDQLVVEPGNLLILTLTIFNHGSLVDHFITSIEGIPDAWLPATPPAVQLA